MKTNYVLIDFENVRVPSLGKLKTGDDFRVWVFLGPNDTKVSTPLALDVDELNERARFLKVQAAGSNSLDFHIAYYMGTLTSADPTGFFHVISKDKGLDPLIQHLKAQKIFAARSESIEEMPCFRDEKKVDNSRSLKTAEELLVTVIEDLKRRTSSKPRTEKTLLRTMHARCGKERQLSQIEAIYHTMKQRGYVRIEGKQVTYKLPLQSAE
jgi:hypothetical protein